MLVRFTSVIFIDIIIDNIKIIRITQLESKMAVLMCRHWEVLRSLVMGRFKGQEQNLEGDTIFDEKPLNLQKTGRMWLEEGVLVMTWAAELSLWKDRDEGGVVWKAARVWTRTAVLLSLREERRWLILQRWNMKTEWHYWYETEITMCCGGWYSDS